MKQWWESDAIEDADAPKRVRAIAYYRHSAQDRQENSIPIQRINIGAIHISIVSIPAFW